MSLATTPTTTLIDETVARESIDTDLVQRMTNIALNMAADDMDDAAVVLAQTPTKSEDERHKNAVKAAHMRLAANLLRTGSL